MPDPQRWTTAPKDVVDAAFLLKCLEAPGRDVVRALAQRPDECLTLQEIADACSPGPPPPQLIGTVADRLARVNAVAESFYRAPLVDARGDAYAVTPEHAALLATALSELERWESSEPEAPEQ